MTARLGGQAPHRAARLPPQQRNVQPPTPHHTHTHRKPQQRLAWLGAIVTWTGTANTAAAALAAAAARAPSLVGCARRGKDRAREGGQQQERQGARGGRAEGNKAGQGSSSSTTTTNDIGSSSSSQRDL